MKRPIENGEGLIACANFGKGHTSETGAYRNRLVNEDIR